MSEGGSRGWLKLLALLSAVALGGGYVGWKQGVAKSERSKKMEMSVEEVAEMPEEELTLIIGSKSPGREVIVLPDDLFEGSAETLPPLMPGSKSIGSPVFSQRDLEGVLGGAEEKEEPLRLLPGSKSINFILDNPARKEEEKEP